jgi:hypothetical protein
MVPPLPFQMKLDLVAANYMLGVVRLITTVFQESHVPVVRLISSHSLLRHLPSWH